ncbi:hypothetical protein ACG7TL_002774 [Trametes sanguinea]
MSTFVRQITETTGVDKPFYAWNGHLHILEVEQFRSEWEALEGDDEGRKRLAQRHAQHVKERSEHTVACQDWLNYLKSIRKVESCASRASRLNYIKERLRDAGYEVELTLVSDEELAKQSFVKKGAPLTDRTWEKIKDAVFDYMEECLEQHIRKEREETIHPRLKMFLDIWQDWKKAWDWEAYDPYDPKAIERIYAGDFLMMEPIRTLIEAPQQSVVRPAHLHHFQATMDLLVRQWHDAQSDKLASLVKTAIPELASHADPLPLALSCFTCAKPHCSTSVLYYPEILGHRCGDSRRDCRKQGRSYEDILKRYLRHAGLARPWSVDDFRVNTLAVGHISGILRACPIRSMVMKYSTSGERYA